MALTPIVVSDPNNTYIDHIDCGANILAQLKFLFVRFLQTIRSMIK